MRDKQTESAVNDYTDQVQPERPSPSGSQAALTKVPSKIFRQKELEDAQEEQINLKKPHETESNLRENDKEQSQHEEAKVPPTQNLL